ncbi:dihydroxyacetone kinase subunit L [Arachnia propionica]|uniref:Dihydroxyacetone kinase subunit L n=1 Tax=Arachnia propionica TaxID=1750 RepID=A0A3P1T6X2_9ACTN|nr:dihydroxyacetone kinase subunit DhaL [Arachnia propionica]MDO5084452.1 dihydroxyacetone kinase subunit DhaL [Arachnia propionica]RRD04153.1 dihydroxyacetone kinase subunit L [Arachnia propionica]
MIHRDQLVSWLNRLFDLLAENATMLTTLDSAIGDADHGANMTRGFGAAVEQLDPTAPLPALFKGVGMTLISTVGGASGPLYGTFFLRMGKTLPDDGVLVDAFAEALRAGLDGVTARGKATTGEKTMVDALTPAVTAFAEAADQGAAAAARAAAEAAAAGCEATIDMVATKGRASYLGERSAGHQDPGATSTALMFQALAETLQEG